MLLKAIVESLPSFARLNPARPPDIVEKEWFITPVAADIEISVVPADAVIVAQVLTYNPDEEYEDDFQLGGLRAPLSIRKKRSRSARKKRSRSARKSRRG